MKIENVENFWRKNLKISKISKNVEKLSFDKNNRKQKLGRKSQYFEEQFLVEKVGKCIKENCENCENWKKMVFWDKKLLWREYSKM